MVLVCVLTMVAAGGVGAVTYDITTVEVPFGSPGTTTATGVNNLGEVVGNYAGPDGDYNGPYPHGFQLINGVYTQITNATTIGGINDSGLAVGRRPGGDGTGLVHDVHTGAQSGFHVPGTYYTCIEGINNAGKVVGVWYHGMGSGAFVGQYDAPELAMVWNHPYVNHRNESSGACGVDNLGRICGAVDAPYDITPEKPYYVGGFITTDPANPGAFMNFNVGAAQTCVTASNTNGTMVGWYYSGGGYTTGFIHAAGVTEPFLVPLPRVIGTQIWDINDRGWLAGGYVQLNEWNQPRSYGFLAKPAVTGIPLTAQRVGNQLVLSWTNAAFRLQCAPAISGSFTNVPDATSPRAVTLTGDQLFFRLIKD